MDYYPLFFPPPSIIIYSPLPSNFQNSVKVLKWNFNLVLQFEGPMLCMLWFENQLDLNY